jgi:Mg2+/Co2+ transporter CorB
LKTLIVKDVMVPLSEYRSIPADMGLADAVAQLEDALEEYGTSPRRLQGLLVKDKTGKVVGKLSPLDLIMALEPTYKKLYNEDGFSSMGISREEIRKQVESLGLWRDPLLSICQRAAVTPVSEIMYTPAQGETVAEDATLAQAMHQLLVGFHQALLVMRGDEIVGVLRLEEVYQRVADLLGTCRA